nr:hypothetical protein [Tanacetum cinerariifolium]
MATTIDQQVALDEALVPSTQRLRIGRSNFRLPSDIQSKESTLQVVYDVLLVAAPRLSATAKAGSDKDDDDNDDEEELVKNDDEDTESDKGGDEVSKSEGESDEEET